MDSDIYERALDALLAAEGGRFDPDVPPSLALDARIVDALRAAPPPPRCGHILGTETDENR